MSAGAAAALGVSIASAQPAVIGNAAAPRPAAVSPVDFTAVVHAGEAMPRLVNTPELRFPCDETRKFEVVSEVAARLAADGAERPRQDQDRGDGHHLLNAVGIAIETLGEGLRARHHDEESRAAEKIAGGERGAEHASGHLLQREAERREQPEERDEQDREDRGFPQEAGVRAAAEGGRP